MFNAQNNSKSEETTEESNETIIGNSVKLEGEFVSQGNITVHGTVVGKIITEREVHIGESATVKADVEATNVYVAGKVNGNLTAKENLEIKNTGKVRGNIQAKVLSIATGAEFTGQCAMGEKLESKKMAAEKEKVKIAQKVAIPT
ncbi:MAG: protein of unknown function DUF583 [uncultured bacterium]|nr:MAG: protein of unknown function DUF583 [uncultured bacterium]